MAHFVAVMGQGVPDPDKDALDCLYFGTGGTATVGLWGFHDIGNDRDCTVSVVSGPGKAKAAGKLGTRVLTFSLTGLNESSVLQGLSGSAPFTGRLSCKRGLGGGKTAAAALVEENKRRLHSGDAKEVFDGASLELVPLEGGFGNYMSYPYMVSINGLAIHITAGAGKAGGFAANFKTRNASTHFVIDRSGKIAQYVAASFQAQAQGPGNPCFLSVEMVGNQGQGAKDLARSQNINQAQMDMLQALWRWVRKQYPQVKPQLACMYIGTKLNKNGAGLGNGLNESYIAMAKDFAARYPNAGTSASINECIGSVGLSCHWWLDHAIKSCPGVPIMSQLPQVLGLSAYAFADLGKYELA